jgi:hypothetical protein
VTVSWAAPVYTAPGDGPAQYEISVLPAPAGYTGPILVSGGTFDTTIPGLAASQRYQIFVRAIAFSGTGGAGAVTYAPSDGAYDCEPVDVDLNRHRCSPVPNQPPLPR